MMIDELAERGDFRLVEDKEEIRRFVERQWGTATGDAEQRAVDYAKRLRARYVAYGEVYEFSSRTTGKRGETRIAIQVRLVDVETEEYIPASGSGMVAEAGDLVESKEIEFARSTIGRATSQAVADAVGKLLKRFEVMRSEGGQK